MTYSIWSEHSYKKNYTGREVLCHFLGYINDQLVFACYVETLQMARQKFEEYLIQRRGI